MPRSVTPGLDSERVEAAVRELLLAIGEDPGRPGLAETPSRVAESYAEFFSGVGRDPVEALGETLPPDANGELVILRGVEFRSICEHHLLPFRGVAHLAYAPNDRIVGLGRLPGVVDVSASRPQLQERLGEQIADALQRGLEPRGVLVILDAVHDCVATRGPRPAGSSTVTVASRGSLAEPAARSEVIALIGASDGR